MWYSVVFCSCGFVQHPNKLTVCGFSPVGAFTLLDPPNRQTGHYQPVSWPQALQNCHPNALLPSYVYTIDMEPVHDAADPHADDFSHLLDVPSRRRFGLLTAQLLPSAIGRMSLCHPDFGSVTVSIREPALVVPAAQLTAC